MGQLALVCQSNSGFDSKETFSNYEMQVVLPSLVSADGKLLLGHTGKAQLLKELEKLAVILEKEESTAVSPHEKVVIINGIVVVHQLALTPMWLKTILDISELFLEHVNILRSGANEV